MSEQLAVNGGPKTRTDPFPSVGNSTGRMFGEEEKRLLGEVIDSGCLNRVGGTKTPAFEEGFAKAYGVVHAVASSSGTAALHVAVGGLNLEPGDEVVTTTITDMGTIIAVLWCQAVPIFADVDPLTGCISAETIETVLSEKTKAVIPVHLFGQPCDMDPIMDLAKRRNLRVIEDCAQAHFAQYKGRMVGTMGDIGAFSFQQSKQLTTGDGGMCITDDDDLQDRMRLFSDKGWPRVNDGRRGHLFLGINYRMTELQAAVGLAQLAKLDTIISRRRATAGKLAKAMESIKGLNPPKQLADIDHSWWIFCFTIDEEILDVSLDDFAKAISAEGMPFSKGYIPNPVFEYPVVADQLTFGTSGWPYTTDAARQNISHDRKDYPGTIWALGHWFITNWNEGYTDADVDDIVEGLTKVAASFAR